MLPWGVCMNGSSVSQSTTTCTRRRRLPKLLLAKDWAWARVLVQANLERGGTPLMQNGGLEWFLELRSVWSFPCFVSFLFLCHSECFPSHCLFSIYPSQGCLPIRLSHVYTCVGAWFSETKLMQWPKERGVIVLFGRCWVWDHTVICHYADFLIKT